MVKEMSVEEVKAALEKAKVGLGKYTQIMQMFPRVNVSADAEFQRLFNGFYKIRNRSTKFCEAYYSFMETHKNSIPSFSDTLRCLYELGKLEASFASKLLATIDPNLPVWDKHVLDWFGLKNHWSKDPGDVRICQANTVYENLIQEYKHLLASKNGQLMLKLFDERYPQSGITQIKKLDLIVWAHGKLKQ